MMTMATSTVDRTTSWCQSLPTTISTPSFTVQLSNVSKFDDCDKKNSCSTNLKVLREIPTRISPKTSSNDAVVALVDDNDDDNRNTTTTTTLPPTMLEGTAAPLPYQLEIARITAAIERMQQSTAEKDALVDDDTCNATTTTTLPPTTLEGQAAPSLPYQSELAAIMAAIDRLKQRDILNNINLHNLQHVTSDMKRAELSAGLATLETNRPVPPTVGTATSRDCPHAHVNHG